MATKRILRGNAYSDSIMTTGVTTIQRDDATSSKHALALIAQEVWSRLVPGAMLSAIMFDIDHFKRINDMYGHDVGDEAIRGVARAAGIESAIVGRANVGRLGGEEFVILIEGRPVLETLGVAESLRARMAALHFETTSDPVTLTCSFGVCQWQPGYSIDQLIKRADVALYKAKREGRNRVVAAYDTVNVSDPDAAGRIIRAAERTS